MASIMKDILKNIYAMYQPDRELFYKKVKNVLDAINIADISQVLLETASWIQQIVRHHDHTHNNNLHIHHLRLDRVI